MIFKNRKNESSKQKELLSQDPTCDGRELGEGKDRGKDRRGVHLWGTIRDSWDLE